MSETKLIGHCIDNRSDPHALYYPLLYTLPFPHKDIDFKQWWNREIIYRADARETGKILPKEKRRAFTRRKFVTDLRNTRGSHLDLNQHEELELLQTAGSMGANLIAELPDGSTISTNDGTLRITISPAAAIMRQISFELLNAYGIKDEGIQY